MKRIPLEPGRVALSTAGRDAGRRFVVLGLTPDGACLLADGDLRRAERPKKKKPLHLRATPECFSSIADMLKEGKTPSDAHLRRVLRDGEIPDGDGVSGDSVPADRPPRED